MIKVTVEVEHASFTCEVVEHNIVRASVEDLPERIAEVADRAVRRASAAAKEKFHGE